ncbi:MAG: helix-turn-helix domain-containing protein [Actinomycetota bacterium]|nr:helix-turn-helix domain-containing protein [Actinomycetota bacterium]
MSNHASRRTIEDPAVLKAMAHPLRQRLYRSLAQFGPATVGQLATRVGGDPGQISYHLRELAKGGFIEQAPELARDGRESWWRDVPGSTTWSKEDFSTPEGEALFDALTAQLISSQFDRLRRFVQTAGEWPQAWQRASVSNQSFLFLTAEELSDMVEELRRVFERWAQVSWEARAAEDTEAREAVFVFLHAFPERP